MSKISTPWIIVCMTLLRKVCCASSIASKWKKNEDLLYYSSLSTQAIVYVALIVVLFAFVFFSICDWILGNDSCTVTWFRGLHFISFALYAFFISGKCLCKDCDHTYAQASSYFNANTRPSQVRARVDRANPRLIILLVLISGVWWYIVS